MRRQNDVWALVWKPVRSHALTLLGDLRNLGGATLAFLRRAEGDPQASQEGGQQGDDVLALQDIKFFALLPNAEGRAWLELPRTFDLKNPDGWFPAEVLPRIERRQERVLWRLTWEGGRGAKQQNVVHAGGVEPDKRDKPTQGNL